MKLTEALQITNSDIVAFVGGGGKTTAMFRLAAEIVAGGGQAIVTTTTRIFAAQIKLAPVHLLAAEATKEIIQAQLEAHQQLLVIGEVENSSGKATGVSVEFVAQLRRDFPTVPIIMEADGSRMRPFKAPAAHEPVIPPETTHVIIVVGADALGQPLTDEHVHRAELVSQLTGAPLGTPLTPAIIARTLTHPSGGLKSVPAQAIVSVLINKIEKVAAQPAPVLELAALLAQHARLTQVLLANAQNALPVQKIVSIEETL
ncbi:MAG: putative selenium-dependent hydroxylase accessory protein YqeC [Anaerolineales bacterium]|nr:putative selenium-dependent hydroxylase accessory protein YqeC [Anaerolineales bacterium]